MVSFTLRLFKYLWGMGLPVPISRCQDKRQRLYSVDKGEIFALSGKRTSDILPTTLPRLTLISIEELSVFIINVLNNRNIRKCGRFASKFETD